MTSVIPLEQQALALPPQDRAQLADKLWASVAGEKSFSVVMTPELERLLNEGLQSIEQARATSDLRAEL